MNTVEVLILVDTIRLKERNGTADYMDGKPRDAEQDQRSSGESDDKS